MTGCTRSKGRQCEVRLTGSAAMHRAMGSTTSLIPPSTICRSCRSSSDVTAAAAQCSGTEAPLTEAPWSSAVAEDEAVLTREMMWRSDLWGRREECVEERPAGEE